MATPSTRITKRLQPYLRKVTAYPTPKIVRIQNKTVGCINRLVQATIIVYIIGWVFIYQKGYQDTEFVTSGVTTKLKGCALTNSTPPEGSGKRIWDVGDYVVPPLENNAFFVMTNAIATLQQKQGRCAENPAINETRCHSSAECTAGNPIGRGNGVMTGNCVPSRIKGTNTCEVYAWCPVENDELPNSAAVTLEQSRHFTVLIKNWVEFAKFSVKRRNIMKSSSRSDLRNCRYHPVKDPFCPIFALVDIIRECGEDYNEMARKGAIVNILITWNCNLDYSIDYCIPKYSFRRLDSKDEKIAKGWNFRYAHYYRFGNGTEARDLYKAYGIRFIVFVNGKAGKFSMVYLLRNLGSGIALLGISTVLCDIIVLHILKHGRFYRKKKFQTVKEDNHAKIKPG